MSKAWDLTCTCKNEYETCPCCVRESREGPMSSVRARFQRELDRAAQRVKYLKKKEEGIMSADWLSDTPSDGVPKMDGYHIDKIPRGEYGESSKILEEVLELQDAEKQGATIMGLHELSDILGAIHGYLRKHHPGMKFEDLVKMANITRRAFEAGQRK